MKRVFKAVLIAAVVVIVCVGVALNFRDGEWWIGIVAALVVGPYTVWKARAYE